MEADLVEDRRPVAAALLGPDVDDRRPGQLQRGPERLGQRADVMPRDDTDVRDPEVLEELPRLREPDDRGAQAARQLQEMRAEDRHALDRSVVGAPALAPGARELDLRQVFREGTDGRADRHLVVVDHDQHLRLALADVVERLERQPAHQRRVADDDRDPLHAVAEITRLGEPLGDRQPRPGVTAVEHVVGRFGSAWEAADAVERSEGPETLQSAREQLVRVGLVAGVPHDPVARRLQQPMEGDRELDDAEGRTEVAARLRDSRDDRFADLGGKLGQLWFGEPAQVPGTGELGQDGHVRMGLRWADGRRLDGPGGPPVMP